MVLQKMFVKIHITPPKIFLGSSALQLLWLKFPWLKLQWLELQRLELQWLKLQ